MTRTLFRIGAMLAGLLPGIAMADYGTINGTVSNIGAGLTDLAALPSGEFFCSGPGCGGMLIAVAVVTRFRPLLTVVGGIVITIFGLKMITSQEDDIVQKARPMMTGLISGLILVWMIGPFMKVFYGDQGGVFAGPEMGQGITVANQEISGLIQWALTLAAAAAIFTLAIVGLKAVFSPTNEENIANIRRSLIGIAFGMVLLALHAAISERFVGNTASPVPLLNLALGVAALLMGFLALAAVVVLVYAGVRLVLSMGNDEALTQARGLLLRASVGFVLIITSLALVKFIIEPALG